MRIHGDTSAGGSLPGCFRMGCMGCLDPCSGVVCVVACLDDGCCVGWEFVLRLTPQALAGRDTLYNIQHRLGRLCYINIVYLYQTLCLLFLKFLNSCRLIDFNHSKEGRKTKRPRRLFPHLRSSAPTDLPLYPTPSNDSSCPRSASCPTPLAEPN